MGSNNQNTKTPYKKLIFSTTRVYYISFSDLKLDYLLKETPFSLPEALTLSKIAFLKLKIL